MNNRIAYIHQVKTPGQKLMPVEVSDDTVKKIGSTWLKDSVGNATREILRGLTKEEEKMYLPDYLGLDPNEKEFPKQVRDFWAEYTVLVPASGRKLNIGTNGDKEPSNLDDYIAYNFAKKHFAVAATDDELDNIDLFEFYIEDTQKKKIEEIKVFEEVDKVTKDYVILFSNAEKKNDYQKVDWILNYMLSTSSSIDDRLKEANKMSPIEKKMEMRRLMEKDPKGFANVLQDEYLEQKSDLSKFVRHGLVEKNGNSYFFGDEVVGENEKEAVAKMKNPEFSGTLLKLRTRLKEIEKTT